MTYNVESIKTMEFSEAVIRKIGMYLSGDLEQAVELGYRELIYNAIDEYLQGYGSIINITIDTKNQIFTCEDNARGIPVGVRSDGVNSLIAALTMPHTGGKHDTEVYAGAVGINGMGASIVTHTSEWLIATVKRDGKIYQVKFKGTEKGAIVEKELKEIGKTKETGTTIQYKPSSSVYKNNKLDTKKLLSVIEELSYFTKGLTFNIIIDGVKTTFNSKNGLADALNKKERAHKKVLYFNDTISDVGVELALQWCRNGSELRPYANNLYVPDGGAFMTGFKTSLTKAFNSVMNVDFSGDIIRKYLDGYVSVKVKVPQFSNQAKTSLANPEARTATSAAITTALKQFATENPNDMEKILDLMDREQRAEAAAQRAREAERQVVQGQKKAKMITNLPAKLADANGSGYKELFIVEGDSAGGTLKMVRNHETQAVLPLKGKVLNTFEKELADILQNQEIKDLLLTLGAGAGDLTNTKNLRYNKVIIATDRDADGGHINILLLAFFLRHMRPLLEQGLVYRVITPLYAIPKGKEKVFLYSDQELEDYVKKHGIPSHMDRFKGLGAHSKEEIEQFLVNENTRRVEQLQIEDMDETFRLFNAMMGNNLELRKILIRTGGDYE